MSEDKNYNLYEDKEKEIIEFLNRLKKESRKFVPHWWFIFFENYKEWFNNFVHFFNFVRTSILLLVLLGIYLLVVNLSTKRNQKMADTEVKTTSSEIVLTQRDKPIVSNVQFYQDGGLLVCETDLYIPQRTFDVEAIFVSQSGEQIAVHNQPVVFNENRKVKFVLPYDPKIKKVKINVK